MSKECTLKFMANQGAGDLFKSTDNGQVFIRMPLRTMNMVKWATVSKWEGGFEADTPVQSGTKMMVVDAKKNLLFEEVVTGDAKKS